MAYRGDRSDLPLEEESEGIETGHAIRLGLAGLAIILAVVFIVQNSENVELNFLVFSWTTHLWVGLVAMLVLGAVLGQGLGVLRRRRRRRRED